MISQFDPNFPTSEHLSAGNIALRNDFSLWHSVFVQEVFTLMFSFLRLLLRFLCFLSIPVFLASPHSGISWGNSDFNSLVSSYAYTTGRCRRLCLPPITPGIMKTLTWSGSPRPGWAHAQARCTGCWGCHCKHSRLATETVLLHSSGAASLRSSGSRPVSLKDLTP